MKLLSEEKHDYVFDGYCHRPYREDFDGWMNEQPDLEDYPEVQAAMGTIAMFQEIQTLKKENWNLRQENKMWKKCSPFSFDK
jgi:hypothetical protein